MSAFIGCMLSIKAQRTVLVEGGRRTGNLTRVAIERRGARLLDASDTRVDAAVFAVGALGDSKEEGGRWKRAVERYTALQGDSPRGIFVVRTLWAAAMVSMLRASVLDNRPWVVLRPGALVDTSDDIDDWTQRVLLTPDIRANGRLSPQFLAKVLADICVQDIESLFVRDVLGLYDTSRMVALPSDVPNLWIPNVGSN